MTILFQILTLKKITRSNGRQVQFVPVPVALQVGVRQLGVVGMLSGHGRCTWSTSAIAGDCRITAYYHRPASPGTFRFGIFELFNAHRFLPQNISILMGTSKHVSLFSPSDACTYMPRTAAEYLGVPGPPAPIYGCGNGVSATADF